MKRNGLLKFIVVSMVLVAFACLFAACDKNDYVEKEIPNLNNNVYMQIERDRLNFMVGMSVDTKDVIAKSGAKLVDDEGNEVNVADYLDDGTITYEEFDVSAAGKDKQIKLKYKEAEKSIMYDVTDFTVNFYLDEAKTNLWKSVKPEASLNDELKLSVYIRLNGYNYSIDSDARSADERGASRFNGWRDGASNPVTGVHSFSLNPAGGVRVENLHAHYLSDEDFQDMALSYDVSGDRVFSGYNGKAIETLRIPEGVTKINLVSTFKSGFNFKKLHIPSTATMELPLIAGVNTSGLEDISVDEGNNYYASYAGALYSKDYKTLYLMAANCVDGIFHSALTTYEYYSCAYWKMASFVLPESVMTIKDYAFAYSSLNAVGGIGASGLNIFKNAFFKTNMKVKEHVIGNKLVALYNSLTDNIDEGPYSLSMITDKSILNYQVIPNTTEISGGVFRDCQDLVAVDLGDSVEKIGASAFSGCTALRKIELPASLKYLGTSAFYNCTALSEVTGLGDVTAMEAKAEYAHAIPSQLFYNCSALTTVSYARGEAVSQSGENYGLAEGIKYILSLAFYKCKSLPSPFRLPTSLVQIQSSAFRDCAKITKIAFPEKLQSIGQSAFFNSGLKTIDLSTCPNVTTLAGHVFRGTQLTKAVIPDWIEEIGTYCFQSVSTLKVLELGKVETIGTYAFSGCTQLSDITWSEKLTTIGEAAFYSCAALKTFSFESVKSIGKNSFRGCTALETIELGENMTTIGDQAFMGCSSLGDVVLPDGVVSVGQSAFSGCNSIKKIYLGKNVKNFGTYAALDKDGMTFSGTVVPATYNCNNLEEFEIDPANTNFIVYQGVLYGKAIGGKDFSVDGDDGSKISSLYAVLYCVPPKYKPGGIPTTKFVLHYDTRVIAPYSFKSQSIIENLTIPDPGKLENIGKCAFYQATSITSLDIPASVKHLDGGILLQSAITKVKIADGNSVFSTDGNIIYTDTTDQATIFIGVSGEVEIRDGVKDINGGLCKDNALVTSVKIPDSVETIGKRAFQNCANITSVEIGSGLKDLGEEGFGLLPKLAKITVSEDNPYMKAINNVIYSKDGKKLLYAAANNGMTSLSEIESGVEEICKQAFSGHKTLQEVILPETVKIIGDEAFFDCVKVNKIIATSALKEIGEKAFSFTNKSSTDYRWNNELKTVILYSGVKIKDNAFLGQYGIEKLYLKMSITELSEFNANTSSNKLYLTYGCPDNANNAYYNNGGRGVDRYIYSDEEPTVFLDGYGWFRFDENGQPIVWGEN